jgi:hypothetical protein
MKTSTILKLKDHDEEKEIIFELNYLSSLSISQRYALMFKRNKELINILEKNGHRRSSKIVKRT